MTLDERLVRLAAGLLPRTRRDARLEEWLADVNGASELGIPPRSVALGALRYGLVHGLRERIAAVRPQSALIGALVVVGVGVFAVPVFAIAGLVISNAVGIVTVATADDGTPRAVFWREYPGVAELDPDAVLAGPSLEEGRMTGEALVAELRETLTAEFGLEWTGDPNESHTPHRTSNRYGGASMLYLVNDPTSQSTSVPRDWADKQRALEIITGIAARYGFTSVHFAHEDSWMTEQDRIEYLGGATPADMVELDAWIEGPQGQWVSVHIRDLRNDTDGRFAENLRSLIKNGWEPESISLMYGANALLPEADRAEFIERLRPFEGLAQPEPNVSD